MGKNNEISDLWSSILFNKPTTTNIIPPYIHPVSNKSSSSLSTESLDVCTESLCSETGSDDFSFSTNEKVPPLDDHNHDVKSKEFVGMNNISTRPSRSIPPPLPSLAGGGRSLLVQSRRQDGRLILEAVSTPSSKPCFKAHRVEGRLLLRLKKSEDEDEDKEECGENDSNHA